MIQTVDVFADYHQFYLMDEEVNPDAPTDYDAGDVERRIKRDRHIVVICPERDTTVPVTVEFHAEEPTEAFDSWNHVADASLEIPSGKLVLHESTGGAKAHFQIAPGTYRVRAFYGGLDTISDNGLEGEDYYKVILWPGAWQEVAVRKQAQPKS